MIGALIIAVVASALLTLVSSMVARRMHPRTTVIVCTAASVIVAAASTGLLALAAWYGTARLRPVASMGGWSSSLLGRVDPLSAPVSVLACAALVVVAVSIVRLVAIRAGELSAAHRTVPEPGPLGVSVMDVDDVDAFALDGLPSHRRVVVTAGLVELLPDPTLQQVVIEHERSHLRHHHLAYRLAVETAARANPLLQPMIAIVDDACEAWADDDAAMQTTRASVAAALASVAIARGERPVPRVAFAVASSGTVRRVSRQLAPTRPTDLGAVAVAGLAVVSMVLLGLCCRRTELFFEALRLASNRP